jgi:hypothetical protein
LVLNYRVLCLASCLLAAPLAGIGSAWAQDSAVVNRADTSVISEETPWFERFSFGSDDVLASGLPNDAQVFDYSFDWSAKGKWGMSLDVRNRLDGTRTPRDEIEVGAFFQITPRIRFGGALSVGRPEADIAAPVDPITEIDAGVKFETGFKF